MAPFRPNGDFHWTPTPAHGPPGNASTSFAATRSPPLETLDANRRAYVTGRAGTGKTRLAMGWARRAFLADERALLTCSNDLLAAGMRAQLPDDERLVIGGFLRVAFELDGTSPLPIPPDADDEWWTTDAVARLQGHWHHITERFDLS